MQHPSEKTTLKTVKKKGVTINPKKEDLMKVSIRAKFASDLESLKEAAKKKAKEKKAKRWWDDDGDGVGYEKGEVSGKFKKEEADQIDTSEAQKVITERLRNRMIQATQDHDRHMSGLSAEDYNSL